LDGLGYRLHALPKAREGAAHPDRNAHFEHITATAAAFTRRGQPVISVDTKKKELVGDFKNGGREWQPTGEPERVRVPDVPGDAVGKAIPYGVYDMARNDAWVSVGRDHDTPAAATAIGRAAGRPPCNAWPTICACVSTSRTFRGARVNGTRSSTGSSATSRSTGAAVRFAPSRPSSS
jgi:hypothetical protein